VAERLELYITKIPGRSGLYLAAPVPGGSKVIARFTNGAESADVFIKWAQAAGAKYEEGDGSGT
jgi:hypothetical protein